MFKTSQIGIVFPGQGSQKLGMLNMMAKDFRIVSEVFNQASDTLNYNLWSLIQEGPIVQLNKTEFTQPALLATEYALWCILKECFNFTPKFLAGHSIGEYAANVCAEVLSFTDALKIVQLRGKLMQEAAPMGVGSMAVISGLSDEVIICLCNEVSYNSNEKVYPAAFNSIGQVTVAGHTSAVNKLIQLSKSYNAKFAKIIPVSVPAHTFFMQEAAEILSETLERAILSSPKIPIIFNINAKTVDTPNEIRNLLKQQIYSPVLWTNTQKQFINFDASIILELGPGKILSDLSRYTIPKIKFYSFNSPEHISILSNSVFKNC